MRALRWCLRRWYLLLMALLLALAAAALLFPYLLKRYIEAHSEEWIDRRVRIGSIVLNPFTGVYAVNSLTCYEPRSDTVFVAFRKLGVKGDLLRAWRKGEWRFRDAELRDPFVRIVQTGSRFNFSDLLELGGSESEAAAPSGPSPAFAVIGVALTGGRIHYTSDALAAPVRVTELSAHCSTISSAQAVMDFAIGLALESGGRLAGGFTIDTERERYAIDARLSDFALAQLRPYLLEFMDCGPLDGAVDIALRLKDSYADTTSLAVSGGIAFSGVALADPAGEPLLRVGALRAELDTLIAAEQRFEVGAVELKEAEARFALLNDGSDNWTRLLKLPQDTSGAVDASSVSQSNVFVLLADYIGYLGREFVASAYSARSLRVEGCALRFADYTPRMPLKYEVDDLSMTAERITTASDTGRIAVRALLGGTGALEGHAAFAPRDPKNLSLRLSVDGLRLDRFDPYARWYGAHPLEDGVLRYATRTMIDRGRIDSRNALRIDRLRFGKRVEEHDTGIVVLPLRLAAGLLKDAKGVVELEIPVAGDLNDPRFRVWPIVWQVLKNLVVKAVTAPGRALVRAFGEADAADAERVAFDHGQAALAKPQRKALDLLARILKDKPELAVALVPTVDAAAERAEIALFEAKRRHLFGDAALSAADSAAIGALANTDSLFVRFVERATPASAGRPLQERCLALAGASHVAQLQAELEYARREGSMQHLLAQGVAPSRAVFREGQADELRGRTGRPGFLFVYSAGEVEGATAP